jgi:hypothetical protein
MVNIFFITSPSFRYVSRFLEMTHFIFVRLSPPLASSWMLGACRFRNSVADEFQAISQPSKQTIFPSLSDFLIASNTIMVYLTSAPEAIGVLFSRIASQNSIN